jgi:hypothetical protein
VLSYVLLGEGGDQFKNHRILAFRASGKSLVAQESNFMGEAMLFVPDPIYSALDNLFIRPEDAVLEHFAVSGFHRNSWAPQYTTPLKYDAICHYDGAYNSDVSPLTF